MTGPDLAALREKAERATADPLYIAAVSSDVILAVLALVEEQRARISTLEKALGKYGGHAPECFREKLFGASGCICGWDQQKDALWNAALDALAGSPAENKEPSCPACDGKGEIEDTIDQHGGGAFWTCMRCGGTGKEPS